MKLKILATAVLSLSLMACGGDSDSSGDNNQNQSLTELAGVYDTTKTDDGEQDIGYLVIKADGTYTIYDFLGDTADNEADCYEKISLKVESLGDNQYKLTKDGVNDSKVITLTKNGDTLTNISQDEGEVVTGAFKQTDKTESSFTPICPS